MTSPSRKKYPGLLSRLGSTDGAGAVEFALLAPVLMFLLFATARVGHTVGVQHALSQLAASAARHALPGGSQDLREALARRYVLDNAGTFPLLDAERIEIVLAHTPLSLAVYVTMDVSNIPDVPIVSAVYRFPDKQTASAVIAVR